MPHIESFPNPPIVEALFDIRANLPTDVDLDVLASVQDAVRDRFPTREERVQWESGFELMQGGPPVSSVRGGKIGYHFRSADGLKIFQARLDGFTLNKLRPYTSWDALIAESKELWEL